METMTDTPTPETNALIATDQHHLEDDQFMPASTYWRMCDFARKLERELAEARRAIEGLGSVLSKASAAYDAITEQRDRLAQERDELRAQLQEEQQLHVQTLNERDDARDQLRKAQVENDHNWRAMELYEAERTLSDKLAALLQRKRDGYGGQMVDPECGCCDCKWLQPIDEALAAWTKNKP